MDMYVLRLALILEMMRYACNESDKQAISIEAVLGAIKLVEYFKSSAVKVNSILSNASPLDKHPADKQALYNALPDTFSQMVDFANNRLFHEANALSNKMLDIHDWLYVEGNPVGIKGAMELLGLCSRDVRLPLVPLSINALDNLALELKKSDFLK
jgi:hypothetical protein